MKALEYIKLHQNEPSFQCECLILPDGSIEEPVPSHLVRLIQLTEQEDLWLKRHMEKGMEPLLWLVEYTQCASVWSTRVVAPSQLTPQQEETIALLHDAAFLSHRYLLEQPDYTYKQSVSHSKKDKIA